MPRFVALYRGINVGGKNPVKMDALRAMHERLGHAEVANYIQSGNVVFTASGSAAALSRGVRARFADTFGFAAHVMVIPESRWRTVHADNPFAARAAAAPNLVHAVLCDGPPDAEAISALCERAGTTERFMVKGDVVYLDTPDGVGRSKFVAGLERACGVPITVRNWRTVEAIRGMLGGAEGPEAGRAGKSATRPARAHQPRSIPEARSMSSAKPGAQSAAERRSAEAAVRALVVKFTPGSAGLVAGLRRSLRRRLPAACEMVYEYRGWFVISYSPSGQGHEGVLAIRGSAEGVRLYFQQGRDLPDPEKLLRGSARVRFIEVDGTSTLTRPAVASLVEEAVARNRVPFARDGVGPVVIRPVSGKKPRRKRSG